MAQGSWSRGRSVAFVCLLALAAARPAARAEGAADAGIEPAFDAFWSRRIEEFRALPRNEKVSGPQTRGDVDLFEIGYDSTKGVRIHAWLAAPRARGGATPPAPGRGGSFDARGDSPARPLRRPGGHPAW